VRRWVAVGPAERARLGPGARAALGGPGFERALAAGDRELYCRRRDPS
jgi:hypothetical protein